MCDQNEVLNDSFMLLVLKKIIGMNMCSRHGNISGKNVLTYSANTGEQIAKYISVITSIMSLTYGVHLEI